MHILDKSTCPDHISFPIRVHGTRNLAGFKIHDFYHVSIKEKVVYPNPIHFFLKTKDMMFVKLMRLTRLRNIDPVKIGELDTMKLQDIDISIEIVGAK